jgi:succinoglycan biosynthesis transport protein ExoP
MTFRTDDLERAVQREDRLDLRGLLRVFSRRGMTILLTLAATIAAAIAFVALSTPLYTASTQLLIDPRDRRVLQTEVTPSGLGGDAVLVESQLRILTSDPVLRRVIASLDLMQDPEFGEQVRREGLMSRLFGGLSGRRADLSPEDDVVRRLSRRVSVRRADRTYIIEVRATSREARKAARIADAVVASYLAEQAAAAQATTRRTTGALTSRLDELRDNLRRVETEAQRFRAQNQIVAGAQGATVTEQQLTELNQRLVLARARVAEVEARVAQVDRLLATRGTTDPGASAEALASNVISTLRGQAAEISRREAELANQLGPRHPAVVDVRSQLENVRRLISEELRRIGESSRSDLASARANERSLSRDLDQLQARTLDANRARIQLREFEREVDAARQLYEAFLTRSLQTSEQERIETVSARVIAAATVPDQSSYPPRLILLAAAIIGGLGLGAGLALLREYLDDTFRSASQLRRATGLDLLAAVPHVGRGLFGRAGALGFDVISRPASPLANAMRSLREELRDGSGRETGRSVLVVSAREGEGKTTVSLNLALTAAAAGERVLVIDADPARRSLSKLVAPAAKVGLFEVLDGTVRLDEALLRDPRSDLEALPIVPGESGMRRPSRTELALLLDAVKERFDLVVLDGGPILADVSARSAEELADHIVMVVRAGATRREEVAEALKLLRAPTRKLPGIVLNMADPAAVTRYEIG